MRLLLRASPRSVKVRRMVAPKGFAARLPMGPPTLQAVQSAQAANDIASAPTTAVLNVDVEFSKVLAVVEDQLAEVCGLGRDEKARASGRVDGPRFALRPALELCSSSSTDGCPAARAWTLTAKWLGRLQRLLGTPAADCAIKLRQAVRKHHHSGCSELLDNFALWQKGVTVDMLWNRPMLQVLLATCNYMAEWCKERQQRLSVANWRTWLEEGPAKGLKRQHRMSRVANGWTPSAVRTVHSDDGVEGDEADLVQLVDGDVHSADTRHGPEPITLQMAVDEEATGWETQWGGGMVLTCPSASGPRTWVVSRPCSTSMRSGTRSALSPQSWASAGMLYIQRRCSGYLTR